MTVTLKRHIIAFPHKTFNSVFPQNDIYIYIAICGQYYTVKLENTSESENLVCVVVNVTIIPTVIPVAL